MTDFRTRLRSRTFGAVLLVPALFAACGETQSLVGHACPCGDGATCCNDVCIESSASCVTTPPFDGGGPLDASGGRRDGQAADGTASDGGPGAPVVPPTSLVLFGGLVNSKTTGVGVLSDTWTWDGHAWTERQVTGPSARFASAAATLDGAAVVFGGTDYASFFGDTWVWNGAAWREAAAPSTSGPAARESASMAPLGNGTLLLFGGVDVSSSSVGATPWFWDGQGWSAGPMTRQGAGQDLLAPLHGSVVDVNTSPYGSVSTWSGADWTSSPSPVEAGTRPPYRINSAVATLNGTVILFGGQDSGGRCLGDTWTWDGAGWTEYPGSNPSPREGVALATVGDVVVLFGGDDCEGNPGNALGDTWAWDGASWTQLLVAGGPPARTFAAMTGAVTPTAPAVIDAGVDASPDGTVPDATADAQVDASDAACVPSCVGKACGADDGCHGTCQTGTCGSGLACVGGACTCSPSSCAGCCTATACLDGTQVAGCGAGGNACWTCGATETCQAGSCAGETAEVVLFGGFGGLYPLGFDPLGDTWTFDGTSWTERATAGPTANVEYEATDLGGVVVLFDPTASQTWQLTGTLWALAATGGPATSQSARAMATLGANAVLYGGSDTSTWTWNGNAWSEHTGSVLGIRVGHSLATLGASVVLFGGEASGGFQNDTWTWDGSAWAQAIVTNPPSARWLGATATLGNTVVLFGGQTASQQLLNDTWIWNGTAWSQVALTGPSPSPRVHHAMATLGNKVVLFGGAEKTDGGFVTLADTWTFDGAQWTQVAGAGPGARYGHAMATH